MKQIQLAEYQAMTRSQRRSQNNGNIDEMTN